VILTQDIVHR